VELLSDVSPLSLDLENLLLTLDQDVFMLAKPLLCLAMKVLVARYCLLVCFVQRLLFTKKGQKFLPSPSYVGTLLPA